MGLNNFILNCEKENKELIQDIECYKNKIKRLEKKVKQRDEVIDKLMANWNLLEKYLDENKMILNNPSIFQFYLIQKEILQKYKGDNNGNN